MIFGMKMKNEQFELSELSGEISRCGMARAAALSSESHAQKRSAAWAPVG